MTLSIDFGGTTNFQWYYNNVPISGETSSSYTKTAALSDTGAYSVTFDYDSNSGYSISFSVTVNPLIDTQQLETAIAEAAQELSDMPEGAYAAASVKDLNDKLTKAKAMLANPGTQAQVDAAAKALEDALMALVPQLTGLPDKVIVGQPFTLTTTAKGISGTVGGTLDDFAISDASAATLTMNSSLTVMPTKEAKQVTVTFTDHREREGSVTFDIFPADGSTSPKTGDDSNHWLWGTLLLLAGMALVGIMLYRQKRTA
ncbi:FIVAR domain-containing protein [Eubacteriales bacterium OttesenSCG-928-M02]|nr:FIVAR domain-containing protein [Eubacteriales bacterium OttesenSCG-928-M02]